MRAIDNKYIGASKLRDDFLDVEDPTVSILTSGRREAPTLFRSNGVYRLLVTETEGWNPSRLHLLNGTHGLKQLPANAATAGSRRNGRLGMAKLPPAFTEAKSPTPPAVNGAFDSPLLHLRRRSVERWPRPHGHRACGVCVAAAVDAGGKARVAPVAPGLGSI